MSREAAKIRLRLRTFAASRELAPLRLKLIRVQVGVPEHEPELHDLAREVREIGADRQLTGRSLSGIQCRPSGDLNAIPPPVGTGER